MATISNTPRPGYVWDSADNVWYPIGVGAHGHTADSVGAIANTLTTTTGDIIYASAANTPARLGIGSTGQVLKVSGGLPAWGTDSGKVLQVVSATNSTSKTSSSTSYVDTNLTATITPTLSTSKILVLVMQPLHFQSNRATFAYGSYRLMRDATSISDQINSFGIEAGNGSRGVGGVWGFASVAYLDSPSTTSATTYKTQFLVDNGADTLAAQESSKPSSIVLMEIGA